MVKRYGFGLFGEFNEQREGVFVCYTDYAHLEAAFARWKAQTAKEAARIDELNAQCAAKDSVIAMYESAHWGLEQSNGIKRT